MIGDISLKYCPVCKSQTEHEQGNFRSRRVKGELFSLDASQSESLQKISTGFNEFVFSEREGFADGDSPGEYVQTRKGGLNFEELFAPQIRSLKCSKCQHLIKISRLP